MQRNLLTNLSEQSILKKRISFNPLRAFIENTSYPAARIYRESFWMGLLDTYKVFVGNHYTGQLRMGIIDVLIFPVIGSVLVNYAQKYEIPIAGILGGILELGRGLIGGVLTLAISPIVAIVHLAATPKAKKLKEAVKNVRVHQVSSFSDSTLTPDTTHTLLNILSKNRSNLTEIRCLQQEQKNELPSPENRTYTSYGWCIKTGRYRPSFSSPIVFKVNYQNTPHEAKNAFDSLNIGRIKL